MYLNENKFNFWRKDQLEKFKVINVFIWDLLYVYFSSDKRGSRQRGSEKDRPLPPLLARVNGQIEVRLTLDHFWLNRVWTCIVTVYPWFFSCVKKITKIGKCATFFFASVIFCDWKKFLMANNTRYYFCILNVFCEVRVHAKKAKITWYMVCFWYEYLQLFKQSSQQAHHHMKWSYFIFLYSVHVHEIDSRLYKFWIWW